MEGGQTVTSSPNDTPASVDGSSTTDSFKINMQNLQPPVFETTYPWTLGSTDGNYALAILNLQATNTTKTTDSCPTTAAALTEQQTKHTNLLQSQQSLYQDLLFRQSSSSVEAVLGASCEVCGFDISEMWLRTGPKTHQLTNSHLRPTALQDSVRRELVDVYYGAKSNERTHRLSPALCKRAKEAGDVVWIVSSQYTNHGAAETNLLECSISNVHTAVAVPVCHEASNTNMTIIFFSMRRYV